MCIDNILLNTTCRNAQKLLDIASHFYKQNRVSYSVFKHIMHLPYENSF